MLITPKEKLFWGWKDFQCPHGTSQIVYNSSARDQMPSPELCIHQTCMWLYSQTCRQNTHTNKINLLKRKVVQQIDNLPGQLKSILYIIYKNNPSISAPSLLPEVLHDPATLTRLLHKAPARAEALLWGSVLLSSTSPSIVMNSQQRRQQKCKDTWRRREQKSRKGRYSNTF